MLSRLCLVSSTGSWNALLGLHLLDNCPIFDGHAISEAVFCGESQLSDDKNNDRGAHLECRYLSDLSS